MTTKITLDAFTDWAQKSASEFLEKSIDARVTKSPISDNPSARLDIDTPSAVARITCWESGDYDAEVIDIQSERLLFTEHGRISEMCVLSTQFSEFFETLGKLK